MAGDLVLLTGATGNLGFNTLIRLLKRGYRVRAAVRNQEGFNRISSLKPTAPYISQLESVIVPDITVPGAYDEAVKGGVQYIIHLASPLAFLPEGADHESHLLQPAIRGTVGILESAQKVTGIKRAVICASITSIASVAAMATGEVITEDKRLGNTSHGPFGSDFFAYEASKALAFEATEKFLAEQKPEFDVINIMPVFFTGRDNTVTEPQKISKGTNGLTIGPLLGYARDVPIIGATVHIDDVAEIHVRSLDPAIAGNQNFLVSADASDFDWTNMFEIVKRRYPKEVADGVFKFEPKLVTIKANIDASKAEKAFGIKFQSFEEQVVSVVDHYLELIGRK